jgi:hypothetical protein
LSLFFSTFFRIFREFRGALHKKVFQVIIFLMFLAFSISIIVFTCVENLTIMNAIYYSAMMISTIGHTSFIPQTIFGKIFTIFFAFIGTGLFLGLVTGMAQFIISQENNNN